MKLYASIRSEYNTYKTCKRYTVCASAFDTRFYYIAFMPYAARTLITINKNFCKLTGLTTTIYDKNI